MKPNLNIDLKLYFIRTSLFLIINSFIQLNMGITQPCNNPSYQIHCEDVIINNAVLPCLKLLDNYCGTLPDTGTSPPNFLCDNYPGWNCTIWFGFIATSNFISINIDGLGYCHSAGRIKVGIYKAPCPPNGQVVVCNAVCSWPPINLNANTFIIGDLYYIWIEGCSDTPCKLGCNIAIDVINGDILDDKIIENIIGPKNVCLGTTSNYKIPPIEGALYYYWTLEGNLIADPINEANDIDLTFDTPGVFKLCVDVADECVGVDEPPIPKCIDITVGEVTGKDPPIAKVCEGKEFNYAGQNYGLGDYDIILKSWQGCDSLVHLTVQEIPSTFKDLGIIYKCKGGCLNVSDKYGNGGLYCTNTEDEIVSLQSWKGCDSIIKFTLRIVDIKAVIDTPKVLGCNVQKVDLIGNKSIVDNADEVIIKWEAFNGGVISGATDVLETWTQTAGKYCLNLIGKAENGLICKDSLCVIVKADPNSPSAIIKGDSLTCFKDNIFLIGSSNTPGVSFSWLGPDSTIYLGDTISVDTPGIYVLSITTLTNCVVKTSFNVILDKGVDSLFAGILGDTITCLNDTVQLSGLSSLPGSSFSWMGPGAFTSNNQNIKVGQTGLYHLTASSSKLCTTDASFNVIALKAIPNVSAIGGTIDCLTGQTILKGNSTTPNVTFKWFDGSGNQLATTQNYKATGSGNYTFEVTDPINGCTNDTIVVALQDTNTPNLSISKSGDLNCKVLSVDIIANSTTPGVTLKWTDGSSGTMISTSSLGLYSVTVTNPANGCKNSTSITIDQNINKPKLSASTDTIKCNNNKTANVDGSSDVTNNILVIWKDPNENTLSNSLDFSTSISQIIKLIVINNTNGCEDSIYLFVPENITIPSFSLVGDTINCIEPLADAKSNTQTPNVNYKWTGPIGSGYSSTLPNAIGISKEGDYTLIVTDKINGCSDSKTTTVFIDVAVPELNAEGGVLNCANNHQIKLNATSPVLDPNFKWTGPGGFSSLVPEPTVIVAGNYYVSVTDGSNGCIADTSVVVGEDEEYPYLTVNNASIDCINKQVTLTASSPVPGVVYNWNGPGIVNNPNPVIITSTPGDYICIATAPNGCSSTKTAKVTFDAAYPIVLIQTDGALSCIKSSININTIGSSNGSEYNYSWVGPAGSNPSGSTFNTAVPGTYLFTISNTTNGCKKDTSITLDEIAKPNSIESEKQDPTCFGLKDGKINITDIGGGTPPYQYSLNGGAFTTKTDYTNLAPGTYKFSIKDALGCSYDTSYNLAQPIKLSVDAGRDTLINWGTQIDLNASPNISGNYNVTWQPLLDSSCINCLHQSIILFNNQIFTVTIKDINDCEASDDVIVRVNKTRPVYIPNVFSPNGDGINDIFYIQSKDNIIEEIEDFRIYDRWGEAVFEEQHCPPNDPSCGWNGKYRGKHVNPSVLVYWAKIRFKDGSSEIFKGDVTVRR